MANYGTVAGGDTYFNARLHGWDWKQASNADKLAALVEATELIDQFDYAEQKYAICALGENPTEAQIQTANASQPLEFPRGTVNTVPTEIEEATYLIAQALLSGRDPEQDLENQTLKTARMGQLTSGRDVVGNTNEHIAHLIPSARAWNKIRPFLRDRNTFTIERLS